MINTVKNCSKAGERFCFIIGAGASVSSGIPGGTLMAKQWFNKLKKLEPKETEKWIKENNFNEENVGNYYYQLYEKRFYAHPNEGYIWLQNAMKDAEPELGYYHLAKILASNETSNNLVITTNFDSLVEDAIFTYTKKKPLVITHELLAPYMDISTNRPIVAKIHRDLLLCPKSTKDETSTLDNAWEPALKKALDIYTPIVIGYGGNDESLMGLLEKVVNENSMKKPFYWCHIHNERPKNEIIELLKKRSGFLVPITDFDTAMYLFGIEFKHDFSKDAIEMSYNQNRIDRYFLKRNDIIHKLKKDKVERMLSDDEKVVIELIYESYRNEIKKLDEKIKVTPKDARLYYNRGINYECLNKQHKALGDKIKAIEYDTTKNATYYYSCGISYNYLNYFFKAIDNFNLAIEVDPSKADFYNRLGRSYHNLKKYENAIENHKKAVSLEQKNAYYHAWLSYSLFKNKYTEESRDILNKAFKLDKDEAFCYAIRGLINLKKAKKEGNKDIPDVLNDFNIAIKKEKNYRLLGRYTDISKYYLYVGDNKKAHEYLHKALKIHVFSGRAWYYLSKYYEAIGESKKSERCIIKANNCKFIPDEDD